MGRSDGHATFSSAVVCGVRSCPNCGPRIALAHRDDIARVVGNARALGYDVRFLTLTLRHSKRDRLADTLDALLSCWKGLTTGRQWMDLKSLHGIVGAVRVIECKYGDRHGWHPHLHVLLFLRPVAGQTPVPPVGAPESAPALPSQRAYVPTVARSPRRSPPSSRTSEAERLAALTADLLARWKHLARAAGYGASAAAQRLLAVTDESLDRMAGYVSKGDIAAEMTGAEFKNGANHWTPGGLLSRAVQGDDGAAALFREYEEATRGRRLYASASQALRALLAAAPAPDEAEAAAEPTPVAAERLARLSRSSFQAVARVRGFRADLAAVAESAVDGWDLAWWLHSRGITATPLLVDGPTGTEPVQPVGFLPAPPGAPSWMVTL